MLIKGFIQFWSVSSGEILKWIERGGKCCLLNVHESFTVKGSYNEEGEVLMKLLFKIYNL